MNLSRATALDRWCALGLALLPGLPAAAQGGAAAQALPPLTQAAQLRHLGPEEAGRGYPVHFRGVVTCFDTEWSLMFVQDASAGIYIHSAAPETRLKVGQEVSVEGISGPGNFAPVVEQARFKVLGTNALPIAPPWPIEVLLSGREDSQWVEVEGVGRAVRYSHNRAFLKVASALGRFDALVCGGPVLLPAPYYVGARLRLRGVCVTLHNPNRQLTGIRLLVPSTNELMVVEPPPKAPLEGPLSTIASLSRFAPDAGEARMAHFRGVVTLEQGSGSFFLQDDSGNLQVRLAPQSQAALQAGDRVEVAGFPTRGDFSPVLEDTVVRRLGPGPPVTPKPITASEAMAGRYDAALVRMEGELVERGEAMGRYLLVLRSADTLFQVYLRKAPELLPPAWPPFNSWVQVAGICSVQVNGEQYPQAFSLELRSPEDLRVLRKPAWWETQRGWRIFGVASVLGLAALLWNMLLRRKVAEQAAIIAQRAQKEAALAKRYQDLVEHANDIIYTHDLEGRFVAANRAGQLMTGYTQEEILRMNFADVVAPEYLPLARRNLDARVNGQATGPYELEILAKDGTRKMLEVNNRLVEHAGQPVAVEGIARDITERKRAEKALRESEARLRLSQQIGRVGSWELDLATGVLTWSDELYRIFGREAATFVPTREAFYAAVYPDDRAAVKAAVDRAVHLGSQYATDHRILWPDGTERFVHEQAQVVGEGGRVRLVGTAQDITERRELEERLRQAQKMEAVGQLAGGVAHDFNNMLMIIQGHLGLMLGRPALADALRDSIVEMLEAARRATTLTQQLLAFSRRQVLETKALDLNEVLINTAKMLRPLLGETIQLHVQPSAQPVVLDADAGKLEQIIMNLAVNARDAMPKGGELTLATLSLHLSPDDAAHNPEAKAGQLVCLTATDTGCGMDAATLGRIFEPFFTTKAPGKGTGLGLSTVYGLVKQHQGWIEVRSAVGRGSTFRIFFPASTGQPELPPMSLTQAAVTYQGHETILLVEDEPALRLLVATVLRRYGYQVIEARNGAEALDLWQQHQGEIQLLLTDMVMPEGLSGRELAVELQKTKANLRVVFTSGYSPDWVAGDLVLREGVNFLQKPYHPSKLGQVIRERLNSEPERVP